MDLCLQIACGGCHMLVFATPRLGTIDEPTFEDVYEPYISTGSFSINDLSPRSSLNRSLSARLRRRERVQCGCILYDSISGYSGYSLIYHCKRSRNNPVYFLSQRRVFQDESGNKMVRDKGFEVQS